MQHDVVRGYKHRLNQLFDPGSCRRIQDAVQYVHAVMANASLLIKYRTTRIALSSEDHSLPPIVLNEAEVWNAVRAVQLSSSVGTQAGTSSSARVNKKADNANDAKEQRSASAQQWRVDYVAMTSRCLSPPPLPLRGQDLSVSHIIGVAVKQYVSAVVTHVRYHYRSYVCRALGIVLRCKALAIEDADSDAAIGSWSAKTFDGLSSSKKKKWCREFGKANSDVLCHRYGEDMTCDPRLRIVVDRHRTRLVPPLPPRRRTIDADLDDGKRVFVYLGYMIRLANFVQKAGHVTGVRRGGPLSPIPVKTSFIPAHYSIDTTGLTHLLLKDVQGFKTYFEKDLHAKGGFPIPGLTSKANVCASLSSLAGRTVTSENEQTYKDALWTYIGRFRNRRTKILNPLTTSVTTKEGAMRFAHSISTDGYSVTMVCSNAVVRGRKRCFRSGAASRRKKRRGVPGDDNAEDEIPVPEAFRQEFPLLTADTVSDVVRYLRDIGCDDYATFVGGDPGKGVLLALVDEFGRKLRYTSSQRRNETDGNSHKRIIGRAPVRQPGRKTQRTAVTSTELRNRETSRPHPVAVTLLDRQGSHSPQVWRRVSVKELELEMCKRRLTAKTSNLEQFKEYVAYREATRDVFETTYQKPVFRAMRFTSWTKRRASVERFAQAITAKFGSIPQDGRQVVILYGDWGRHPNLKHQKPSPGIGLRRVLHAWSGLTTITVRETYTSSYDPNTGRPVEEARGVHALLRECHQDPSTDHRRGVYWSRDVLGALNILRKGCHLLRTGVAHPLFGK